MTKDENEQLAKEFEQNAKDNKEKGNKISAWEYEQISKLHYHFSENHEKYSEIVQSCTRIRKNLLQTLRT